MPKYPGGGLETKPQSKGYRPFTVTRHSEDNKKQMNQLSFPREVDCKSRKDIN